MKRPGSTDQVVINAVPFTFADIHSVVDSFYAAVQRDAILQLPFQSVSDWPHHVERLTHFWWTRFGGRAYQNGVYNPVVKHYEAGFDQALLARWLALFDHTLRAHLKPEQAEVWISVAHRMGVALSMKNQMYSEQKRAES